HVTVQPDITGTVAQQFFTVAANIHRAIGQAGSLRLNIDAGITVVQNFQTGIGHLKTNAGQSVAPEVAVDNEIGIVDHPVSGVAGIALVVADGNAGVVDADIDIVEGKTAGLVVTEIYNGICEKDRIIAGTF